MRRFAVLSSALLVAIGVAPAWGADGAGGRVTFTKDVLSILQEKCQDCHRPGGDNIAGMVAPMSLMTYQEVRPWAKAISRAVHSRQMPPWDATDETAGVFVNERTLTEDEISTIVQWVETGAARGSARDAPAAIEFEDTGGWLIGEPDLIVRMPEAYWVADDVVDIQPRVEFTITEEQLPEPRWIQAIEYQPDSEVVHHITGRATAPAIDGHEEETFTLGSIAAGEDPTIYPEGFGNLLRAGTTVSISLHYHKEMGPGTGVWDQSAIGFKFHPAGTEVKHKVSWNTVGNFTFEIPPGHSNWEVGGGRVFEKDTVLLSIHPHMHYRGKDMKYTAYYPDGTEEVLLNVDRYEYGWQTNYLYRTPKILPAGTLVEVTSHFDNSEARKELVPKLNVQRPVRFGGPSTDEMMNPFLSWTYVEPEEAEALRARFSAEESGTD
ncbi:MAG: c-type cytochrome [Candidatus Hydrogenedentes bacterium]|nr:c-type cytochrome [Candidatus Hydrogenedentota bacterium]